MAHFSEIRGEIRTAPTRQREIAPWRKANIKMKDIDIVQNRSNRDLSGCSHLEAENVRQMLLAWIFAKPVAGSE